MPSTRVTTYVNSDVLAAFTARFGGKNAYGLIAHTLETTMREMLDMTDGQPELTDVIRQAVRLNVLKTKTQAQVAE